MKIIELNEKAREKVNYAINYAGNIARSTLGPTGQNVLVGSKFLKPLITNDGLRAVKAIELEDEVANAVVRVMEDGMQTTNDQVGDARTATAIFIQEIWNEAFKRFPNPDSIVKLPPDTQAIKREIDEAYELVEKEIRHWAHPIESLEDVEKVAFVASEDKDLAKMIAEVVHTVGKDGVVKVEECDSLGVQTSISEGMEIKSGYVSSDMVTNDKKESVVEDAFIFVTNKRIDSKEVLSNIVGKLIALEGKKELVVFASDFDHAVIRTFNLDRLSNSFRILAVRIPPWDKGLLEDICTISGATVVEEFASGDIQHLGKVTKVISNLAKTILIGGEEDKSSAVKSLQAELDITTSPFEKEKIKDRIGRITGKVALIEVGGVTEIDRIRLKDKISDAVHAAQGALEEGVLRGAGRSLYEFSKTLPVNILTSALKAPYEQIKANMTGEVGEEIIDSAKSMRMALKSACNVAGNLLTVGTIIVDKNESDTE